MTQQDRDRLVALKKAKKGLITQRQAAEEIGQSERHIRRLLKKLKAKGDAALVHALRGRRSNRKLDEKTKQVTLKILGREVYAGFGPTLAAEYLADKHDIHVGRETVRHWMIEGKLWRAKQQRIEKIHEWRQRRSRVGELVQWDTSEHAWLEERGPKLYLIGMIDDASSRVHARFVMHDSTQENMRLLWSYLERYGRPVGFYTDKASLFQTAPKIARDQKEVPRDEREPLPPTQIGRALAELDIVWIAAHSPQAKGRVERSFQTAQDRLVKGLRVAGARTLEQANAYLETKFLPWWNQTLTVVPASADDAHRSLDATHSLAASLSYVETRQVNNDYTIQFDNKIYQIARDDIRTGLRGADVRVEVRLDASLAVRFRGSYLTVSECHPRPKASPAPKARKTQAQPSSAPRQKSPWMKNFIFTSPEKAALSGLLPPLPAPAAKPIR
jgi:DNA-binding IscR family transcriptional regulator